MKSHGFLLLVLSICGWGIALRGERDFLTAQEISQVRDAQQPSKRIILYLEFAQRRLDTVKQNLASRKPDAGRAIQKNLDEYISILEALEGTFTRDRYQQFPSSKSLKEVGEQGDQFAAYLRSVQSSQPPNLSDYRFTLEEAIEVTREVIVWARKGPFPEVEEREPPSQFPSRPPPPAERAAPEEAPPRK